VRQLAVDGNRVGTQKRVYDQQGREKDTDTEQASALTPQKDVQEQGHFKKVAGVLDREADQPFKHENPET